MFMALLPMHTLRDGYADATGDAVAPLEVSEYLGEVEAAGPGEEVPSTEGAAIVMDEESYTFKVVTTKSGDSGKTEYYGNKERQPKTGQMFVVVGALDELNSHLGVVKAHLTEVAQGSAGMDLTRFLEWLQRMILRIGALYGTDFESEVYGKLKKVTDKDIGELEADEQRILAQTHIPRKFVLPGLNRVAAFTDVARTVCRRAEIEMLKFIERYFGEPIASAGPRQDYQKTIVFVNRLSDYLFVLARSFESR